VKKIKYKKKRPRQCPSGPFMKITVLWVVALSSLVDRNQCFGGKFCLHFGGKIMDVARVASQ
jgi:hypothetical protein